jgi:hypothetical protein
MPIFVIISQDIGFGVAIAIGVGFFRTTTDPMAIPTAIPVNSSLSF